MTEIENETLPKLGFLGVGWIGKNRLEALISEGLTEDISIFDPHQPSVENTLKSVPSAKVSDSFNELLESDVDGIVIATPSALHSKQAIQALERGKAVFCQKPLGRDLSETKAVIHAAQQANKLLAVDYSYRFTQGIAAVKDVLEQERIGKVFAVEAVFHNAFGPDKAWFYDPGLSGGGCLIDLGSHLVDLLFYLFKAPSIDVRYANLLAQGRQLVSRGERVEDFAEAQLKTSTGISIHLACSWKLSVGKDAQISLKIYGTEGGVSFHNVNGSFYDFQTDIYTQNNLQTVVSPPDDWGGRAIQNWGRQLAGGNQFNPENYELIKSAALLEEIYKYTGI